MVADVFDRPEDFMNREIEVASVDMTMPEIAAALSRVLGKTVQYQQIPFEAFEQQVEEELTILFRWFEDVGYAADLAQLKRDFPAPTNFESYLRDHDWQNQPEAHLMSGRGFFETTKYKRQPLNQCLFS